MKDVRPSLHTGSDEGIAARAHPSMPRVWVTVPMLILDRLPSIEQSARTSWRYTSNRFLALGLVPRLRIVSRALSHHAWPMG